MPSLFASQNIISRGIFYRWGFYTPDGPGLDEIANLVDEGKVLYGPDTNKMHSCHSVPLRKWMFSHLHSVTACEIHPGVKIIQHTEYEHTMDTIHACI